jgi:hypothetical protein
MLLYPKVGGLKNAASVAAVVQCVVLVNDDGESTTIALRRINPKNLKLITRTKPYYVLLVEVDVLGPFWR